MNLYVTLFLSRVRERVARRAGRGDGDEGGVFTVEHLEML